MKILPPLRVFTNYRQSMQSRYRDFLPNASVVLVCLVYLHFLNSISSSPIGYHPDEGGKVSQILGGRRNFYHPQLLVEINYWINALTGNKSAHLAFEIARGVSNIFAAMTVFLFSHAIKISTRSNMSYFLAAILLSLSAPLILAGHYIKEDIYLFFSLGFNTWAIAFSINLNSNGLQPGAGPERLKAMLVGLSYALLSSSKYPSIIYCLAQIFILLFTRNTIFVSGRQIINVVLWWLGGGA